MYSLHQKAIKRVFNKTQNLKVAQLDNSKKKTSEIK